MLKKPSLQQEQTTVCVELDTDATGHSKQNKRYFIHKAFLFFYSPFFTVWSTNTKSTDVIVLEGISHEAFGIFVHWIYYQDLKSLDITPSFNDMIRAWNMSASIGVPVLQNSAMDWLHEEAFIDSLTKNKQEIHWGEIFKTANQAASTALLDFLRDLLVATKDNQLAAQMVEHTKPSHDGRRYPSEDTMRE
ncbi:uncharacterized protein RAG0_00039 [Rhynchosporium agropyri]|uniref:BTB domain-containing protein n=1 Tax=Rhynchosporium agropyri TaxID=914238 RepID=A0A1E1JR54_9HELO|nr:uncharacterized protein RAG0_00039 [Rhynchosporium agropyri]